MKLTVTIDEALGKTDRSRTLGPPSPYNSTKQSWYIAALSSQSSWSQVAVTVTTPPSLFIAYGKKVVTNGQVVGVVGCSLILNELSDFVQKQQIGKKGRLFIMERTSNLLASA